MRVLYLCLVVVLLHSCHAVRLSSGEQRMQRIEEMRDMRERKEEMRERSEKSMGRSEEIYQDLKELAVALEHLDHMDRDKAQLKVFSRDEPSCDPPTGIKYELTVYTSDVDQAQTNGQMYITLTGDNAVCPEMLLNKNPIQRNSVFNVTVTCPINIGRLVSVYLRLETDDGWHMDKIFVSDKIEDVSYEIDCDCWFDNNEPPAPGNRTLTPVSTYELTVYTSDVGDAQTNGQMYFTLNGYAGSCPEMLLNDSPIQRNSVFNVTAKCPSSIGRLVSIHLRLETDDGWRMDKILVLDTETSITYEIDCDCWFDNNDPNQPNNRTLTPVFKYEADVWTGDVTNADTDGNVYVTLQGDKALCPEFLLNANGDPFERDSKLAFTISCPYDVGILSSVGVRLETDTNEWLLNTLIIRDPERDSSYQMDCNCWFDDGEGAVEPPSRVLCP